MPQLTLVDTSPAPFRVQAVCPPGVDAGTILFRWPHAVRHVWKRPQSLGVDQWSEKYRYVSVGPRPGLWCNAVTPYLTGLMAVYFLSFLREIALIAPPQTGKTEFLLNCLGASIDQTPGPALMVYDQQETAKRMCTTRVRDMIMQSPRLRRYVTGRADDFSNYLITLQHMQIPFSWATSLNTLSNQAIEKLFLDEVDKYEGTYKNDAGPVASARLRTRSYKHTSKTLLTSSPGKKDGQITIAYNQAQCRAEYVVQCPDCLQYHVMLFTGPNGSGVVWPQEERNPETLQAGKLARYICPVCGSGESWDDYKRDVAVGRGHWREVETHMPLMTYCERYRPRSVGAQYSALISPFVSLSETAAKFVLAQQELKVGRVDAHKNWLNNYMGEGWEEDFAPRKHDVVLALRDERPAGVLPDMSKVSVLLAQIDTQDDGFWYEIRAWGYGQEMESWQVRAGFVAVSETDWAKGTAFDGLDSVLWIPYMDAEGNEHSVYLACIDSQGHHTTEVYEWCLRYRGRTLPIKGEQTMKQHYKLFPVEFWPGTDKKMPGGLKRLHINTNHYKNNLHHKLSIAPADPGAYHMNADCTEAWAQQMCAEHLDEKQNWVCPKGKPNHAGDVSVYSLCLADFVGVRYKQPEEPEEEDETATQAPRRRRRSW